MPDRFQDHRERLARQIGADAIAVVPASRETIRNHDVHPDFRQGSDFYYLTGFEEPDAVCVLAPGHPDGEFHLFVRPRDREMEIWNGYRAGTEGALQRFQADAAHELSKLDEVLGRMVVGREVLYYRFGDAAHDDRMTRLLSSARAIGERYGKRVPTTVGDVGVLIAEQRLRKSPSEVESLSAACELSAEGHREAMRFCLPGMYEYQVMAAMEYVWREGGSRRNGYPSIVASGPNAIVLHYVENDRMIDDGDLVLIDAGAEVDYYSADITRTFPAGGVFSGPQRAVYEVVLAAQHAGIRAVRPGTTIDDVHEAAKRVLAEGMVDLGLVPRGVDDVLSMHL